MATAARKPSGLKPPSAIKIPSASKVTSNVGGKGKGKDKVAQKKGREFQLPPLSISVTGKKPEINFEEMKRQMIRRHAPAGEDKKALAKIIRSLKCQRIRVQEFVNLISAFTGDNGETMRKIVEEEISSFRKLVKKIYETMTQDVSDVLVNEQFQTSTYYSERCEMIHQKVLTMITEIYEMAPGFNLERYYQDKLQYLNEIMPLPALIVRDEVDIEMQRRQEMFHRLQWLRYEGTRLYEENIRLQQRLTELKQMQKFEQMRISELSEMTESKKMQLEAELAQKTVELQELTQSLGVSIIRSEAYERLRREMEVRNRMVPTVPDKSAPDDPKRKPHCTWVSKTAKQIEQLAIEQAMMAEKSVYEASNLHRHKEEMATEDLLISGSTGIGGSTRVKEPPPGYPPQIMEQVIVDQTQTITQEKQPVGGYGAGGSSSQRGAGGLGAEGSSSQGCGSVCAGGASTYPGGASGLESAGGWGSGGYDVGGFSPQGCIGGGVLCPEGSWQGGVGGRELAGGWGSAAGWESAVGWGSGGYGVGGPSSQCTGGGYYGGASSSQDVAGGWGHLGAVNTWGPVGGGAECGGAPDYEPIIMGERLTEGGSGWGQDGGGYWGAASYPQGGGGYPEGQSSIIQECQKNDCTDEASSSQGPLQNMGGPHAAVQYPLITWEGELGGGGRCGGRC